MSTPGGVVAVLQRIGRSRSAEASRERCEMCGAEIGPDASYGHSHVVDLRSRALMCTCRACWLLFTHDDADLALRAVPERYAEVAGFAMSHGQWDELAIPVGVAFLFSHSELKRVAAFYPSPAGATESELPLSAWSEVVAANPALEGVRDDVEAVLLRRTRDDTECFVVPIDRCYELVGHLRRLWRGFDGGSEVHRCIEEFFADVRSRCR